MSDPLKTTKTNYAVVKNPKPTRAGVVQVFLNADLRNGHDGLTELARKNKVDVTELEDGQFVVFINSAKTKIKVYAAHENVVYHRSRTGRLEMAAVDNIPRAFHGDTFSWDAAVKEVLLKVLSKRQKKVVETEDDDLPRRRHSAVENRASL